MRPIPEERYLGSTQKIAVGDRELVVDLSGYSKVDKRVPSSVAFKVDASGVLELPRHYLGPLTFVSKETRRSKKHDPARSHRNHSHPLLYFAVAKPLPLRVEDEEVLSKVDKRDRTWARENLQHRRLKVSAAIYHRGLNKLWNGCWRRLLVWLDPVALKLAREIQRENPLPLYNLLCARPDLRQVVQDCHPLGLFVDATWPHTHDLEQALRYAELPTSGAFRAWAERVRFWPLFTPLRTPNAKFVLAVAEWLEGVEPAALEKLQKPIHWRMLALAAYHAPDLIPGLLEEPDFEGLFTWFTADYYCQSPRVHLKLTSSVFREGLKLMRIKPKLVQRFPVLHSRVLQLCITDKLLDEGPAVYRYSPF